MEPVNIPSEFRIRNDLDQYQETTKPKKVSQRKKDQCLIRRAAEDSLNRKSIKKMDALEEI